MNQFFENFSRVNLFIYKFFIINMNSDTENSTVVKGRKRVVNFDNWASNIRKQARNSGKEYVTTSGILKEEKIFQEVVFCCKRKLCYCKIEIQEQEKFFDEFWFLGNYGLQNYYLKHLLKYRSAEKVNAVRRFRLLIWKYFFPKSDVNEEVCLKFMLSLLQISQKRMTNIQNKIVSNMDLNDKRGKHEHFKILSSPLMKLIRKHCESLPHHQSHYKIKRTSLNYFDDSSLDLRKMYLLFLDFYAADTGDDNIPLSEKTYSNFFNYYINFSFTLPRTDMCDILLRI